ncbi:MAG: C2H2-type zinc finger protein [Nitrososphaera sp.]|jgi:hypothetical protein
MGSDATKIAGDYHCFVCGAVFTTDEDRMQHLEKEEHGKVRDETTKEEKEVARVQEGMEEGRSHLV